MTYEPTQEEIEAACETFINTIEPATGQASIPWSSGDRQAQDIVRNMMRAALIAAHAARPVPAGALDVVAKVRKHLIGGESSEHPFQSYVEFDVDKAEAAALVDGYGDARVAEMRALIDEAATALAGWQEWWELPWEAKRHDFAQRAYDKAAATLAKLRAVKEG